jgi:predicted nucleotidyltransferase
MLQTHKDFYSRLAERVRRYSDLFEEFIKDLCSSGLVEEVYLVGSRARGDYVESSDFDVVVIIKDDEDPLDIAMRVRLLKKSSIPLDVIVLRVGESKDPIYVEMLRYARKLC